MQQRSTKFEKTLEARQSRKHQTKRSLNKQANGSQPFLGKRHPKRHYYEYLAVNQPDDSEADSSHSSATDREDARHIASPERPKRPRRMAVRAEDGRTQTEVERPENPEQRAAAKKALHRSYSAGRSLSDLLGFGEDRLQDPAMVTHDSSSDNRPRSRISVIQEWKERVEHALNMFGSDMGSDITITHSARQINSLERALETTIKMIETYAKLEGASEQKRNQDTTDRDQIKGIVFLFADDDRSIFQKAASSSVIVKSVKNWDSLISEQPKSNRVIEVVKTIRIILNEERQFSAGFIQCDNRDHSHLILLFSRPVTKSTTIKYLDKLARMIPELTTTFIWSVTGLSDLLNRAEKTFVYAASADIHTQAASTGKTAEQKWAGLLQKLERATNSVSMSCALCEDQKRGPENSAKLFSQKFLHSPLLMTNYKGSPWRDAADYARYLNGLAAGDSGFSSELLHLCLQTKIASLRRIFCRLESRVPAQTVKNLIVFLLERVIGNVNVFGFVTTFIDYVKKCYAATSHAVSMVLSGMPTSGKSTFVEHLASSLHLPDEKINLDTLGTKTGRNWSCAYSIIRFIDESFKAVLESGRKAMSELKRRFRILIEFSKLEEDITILNGKNMKPPRNRLTFLVGALAPNRLPNQSEYSSLVEVRSQDYATYQQQVERRFVFSKFPTSWRPLFEGLFHQKKILTYVQQILKDHRETSVAIEILERVSEPVIPGGSRVKLVELLRDLTFNLLLLLGTPRTSK